MTEFKEKEGPEPNVKIVLDRHGMGKVFVNGNDISAATSGFRIENSVYNHELPTKVVLTLVNAPSIDVSVVPNVLYFEHDGKKYFLKEDKE